MIDHISLRVRDFDKARAFYAAALAPLGYEVIMEFPGAAGLGADRKPDLWVTVAERTAPTHIAFVADRAGVDAFYAAAIAAGGTDNGKPGLRAEYHPNYYGAFVLDAEGNNIEAVCHLPPGAARAKRPAAKKASKKTAKKASKKSTKKSAKKAAKKTKR